MSSWRSATAPATPFRCCTTAASRWRRSRSPSACAFEHPQSLIDRCRFADGAGHPRLGAADYKLVHHGGNGRFGLQLLHVPGGTVVAAASEPGRSGHQRHEPIFAQRTQTPMRAIVVGVTRPTIRGIRSPVSHSSGIGRSAHSRWRRKLRAPAQRVGDFLAGRAIGRAREVVPSYQPAVTPADLAACLPDYVTAAIREALPASNSRSRASQLPTPP